jgi:hypothetical protein
MLLILNNLSSPNLIYYPIPLRLRAADDSQLISRAQTHALSLTNSLALKQASRAFHVKSNAIRRA